MKFFVLFAFLILALATVQAAPHRGGEGGFRRGGGGAYGPEGPYGGGGQYGRPQGGGSAIANSQASAISTNGGDATANSSASAKSDGYGK